MRNFAVAVISLLVVSVTGSAPGLAQGYYYVSTYFDSGDPLNGIRFGVMTNYPDGSGDTIDACFSRIARDGTKVDMTMRFKVEDGSGNPVTSIDPADFAVRFVQNGLDGAVACDPGDVQNNGKWIYHYDLLESTSSANGVYTINGALAWYGYGSYEIQVMNPNNDPSYSDHTYMGMWLFLSPDLNADGEINLSDSGIMSLMMANQDEFVDFSYDAAFNLSDYGYFTAGFGKECP